MAVAANPHPRALRATVERHTSIPRVLIRELDADDLPFVYDLLETPPWDTRAGELRAIATEAAGPPGREHEGLCCVDGEAIAGVVLFRFVAGAVHTGEIECVAATKRGATADTPPDARAPAAARELLAAAIEHLREGGARLVVAEYPGEAAWRPYADLLESAGFVVQAAIDDYFAEGIALTIAALREA